MPGDVTQLLDAIDSGDTKAAGELLPLVYDELRKLAASRMANERDGHTLQPTALVHEAWLRLGGGARACHGNPALRRRLDALVAAHERPAMELGEAGVSTVKAGGDIQDVDEAAPDPDAK